VPFVSLPNLKFLASTIIDVFGWS